MLDNNEITIVQDTSTHAMTEVALGLSMAFFALLIIALMSVSLPTKVDDSAHAFKSEQKSKVDTSEQVRLTIQNKQNGNNSIASLVQSNELVLLYWGGQFFDTQQQIVNANDVMEHQNVIVAVDPQIAFNQLINIQTKFAGKTLRLTQLSEQWQLSLKNDTRNDNAGGL